MTAQFSDTLHFASRQFTLDTEPLSPWLQRRRNRHLHFKSRTTALSRGYVGVWEVIDGLLYLKQFTATMADGAPMDVGRLFPGSTGPVPAVWFSGALICPMGKLLKYEHSSYASTYEYELILWFIEGQLVEQRLNRNRPPPPPAHDDGDELRDIEAELENEMKNERPRPAACATSTSERGTQ